MGAGWLRVSLGALGVAVLGCSEAVAGPVAIDVSADLPEVSGAYAVPLHHYWWVGPGPEAWTAGEAWTHEPSDARIEAMMVWLQGEDVGERALKSWFAGPDLGLAVVEVLPDGVRVGGQQVLALDDGRMPEGLPASGFVRALYDPLVEARGNTLQMLHIAGMQPTDAPLSGGVGPPSLLFVIDESVPFDTVRAVMYSAGQAGYFDMGVVVEAGRTTAGLPPRTGADARELMVEQRGADAVRVWPRGGGSRATGVDATLDTVAVRGREALGTDAVACALVAPDLHLSWGEVAPTLGALVDGGVASVTLASPAGEQRQEVPSVTGWSGQTWSLAWDTEVAVIPLRLPSIGPPGEDRECGTGPKLEDNLAGFMEIPSTGVTGGIGGLIGAKGTQIGSGGLGSRGSGLGGGGTAEGLGGLGTKGSSSGYGGHGTAMGEHARVSTPDGIQAEGPLDLRLIEAVVERHMNQLRYCYQRELVKDASLAGTLDVRFVIAADGTVASSEVTSSTMENASVDNCYKGRFIRFKFPEAEGETVVKIGFELSVAKGGG